MERSTRASKRLRKAVSNSETPRQMKKIKLELERLTPEKISPGKVRVKDEVVTLPEGSEVVTVVTLPEAPEVKPRLTEIRENNSSVDSADNMEDDFVDFEKRRLQNIQDNKDFLAKLGIMQEKQSMKENARAKKTLTKKVVKEKERAPSVRRTSMRLKRVDPTGTPLPQEEPAVHNTDSWDGHQRPPSGPLPVADFVYNDRSSDDVDDVLRNLHNLSGKVKVKVEPQQSSTDSYVSSLSSMRLNDNRVQKLVPQRIFSVCVHPSETVTMAAVGDKWGRVGLWDVDRGSDGVFCFNPHSRPVSHVTFSPVHAGKLFTSSYDGTIRCLDTEKNVFNEVFGTPPDEDDRVSFFSFLTPDTLVAGLSSGELAVIDMRTPRMTAEELYLIHHKNVKSTSVHPLEANHVCTASTDSTACIWDIRNMKPKNSKPLHTACHGKSVDSAYFSPLTGKYLLTTSIDNTINIYDSTDNQLAVHKRIRHDNHTGRWLSNFRAVWHPAREDVFVTGSMAYPRQIEMFDTSGARRKHFRCDENLNSVCSLNALHPTRNILIGANSSGRVFAFM